MEKHNHRYGTDPANLAHARTDNLLAAFTRILTQCRHMLRPGGTVAVTTRPWRERGELIDLPSAVLAAGENAGLIPTERCVALLAGVREGQLVTWPSFFQMKNVRDARRTGLPLHLIAHEDLLIFRAPAIQKSSLEPKGGGNEPKRKPCPIPMVSRLAPICHQAHRS
ncbi:hypothetical protein ACWGCW_32005 [Streptomyces sp. NPDC054933]